MPPTVYPNKMSVVSQKKGSAVFAFPDVCKMPAPPQPFVPLPYPGITYDWSTSSGTKLPGSVVGKKVAVKGSEFASAQGNEPGTLKEVTSFNTYGPTTMMTGAPVNAVLEGSLKSHLSRLHGDMMNMRGGNPELWHAAIDNYVRLIAELYKSRTSS